MSGTAGDTKDPDGNGDWRGLVCFLSFALLEWNNSQLRTSATDCLDKLLGRLFSTGGSGPYNCHRLVSFITMTPLHLDHSNNVPTMALAVQ